MKEKMSCEVMTEIGRNYGIPKKEECVKQIFD